MRPAPSARRSGWVLAFGSLALVGGLATPVGGQQVGADTTQRVDTAHVADTSGLELRLNGRAELGGDWTRFSPCDETIQFTCVPSLLPQLTPDLQFGLNVQGSVFDRFFVDVDYDQSREFSAANRIGIRYQGLAGEALRSVEIGDVSFDLPNSRFLTRGIPAGNLGVRAVAGVGPFSVEGVWAQQRGDLSSAEFRFVGVGSQGGFVQRDTLVLDDADYIQGQFFFLVDPRSIDGYPHLDILELTAADAPAEEAPGPNPIQLFRSEENAFTRGQVEGFFQAEAVAGGAAAADAVREAGWFRTLEPGTDYEVHSSGLWAVLRRPLRREEILGTAFVTHTGDSVGAYNPERIYNQGDLPVIRLLRGSGPNHQPGRPTWDFEMHQVYRLSGSNDVDPESVDLQLSLGEISAGRTFARAPDGTGVTYLRLFGLDEASPVDEIDNAQLYRPAAESALERPPVSGTFLVFPTLRPFAAPPASPGLTPAQAGQLLGADSNTVIYEDPDPLERAGGGLYRLTLDYTVRSRGLASSFSLGGVGVRDGSERLYLGDRLLVRGRDYEIDYDLGDVQLLDPQGLFSTAPGQSLRATWEERSAFQIAPVSVFGLGATLTAGDAGALQFIGLYQTQQELARRPQLGVEPSSIFLAGVSGEFTFTPDWLERGLSRIPRSDPSDRAQFTVKGELAISAPDPNTRGDVFLDDFDRSNQLRLPRLASGWRLGSAPTSTVGAELDLPPLTAENATKLVWQHQWIQEGFTTDSVFQGFFPTTDIDRQIEVTGSQVRETGLLLTFAGGPAEPERVWSSFTALLSETGIDLSKSEFIEFYAADGDSVTLVLDLGTVNEDAFFVDESKRTSGLGSDEEPWGLGRLDQEADPRRGQVWSTARDQAGVWGETCLAEPAGVYPAGDPRANCTRNNGRVDTEDMDGDGVLDTSEKTIRYVVRLDDSSPFLARSRSETGTAFRLYRIPLRGPNGIPVQGDFTEADWRGVKHLRVTMAGRPEAQVVLARFNVVGTQWVRRGASGVLRGLGGDTLAAVGSAEVGSVSRITVGERYEAPPGVLEQLDDPSSALSGQGVEFNERSLGLHFADVDPGSRMEVYNRFPQRPRNFLEYGEARLWVTPSSGAFAPDSPLYFFFKVGSDADNFYLYRTPLRTPSPVGAVRESDWLPEVVIDFDVWLDLRREAEAQLISNPPRPGGPPVEVWSADSTYAVVLRDRARAPVLAAVREMSMGVWNNTDLPASGEVWVNELRLSRAVKQVGVAGHLDLLVRSGDAFETQLVLSYESPFFRQLDDQPTYRDETVVSLRSRLQLGAFLPQEWGFDAPLVVTRALSGQNPLLLAQSDIRAAELANLRTSGAEETRVAFAFRKTTSSEGLVGKVFLDALDASVAYSTGGSGTVTTDVTRSGLDARVGYGWDLEQRLIPVVPSFMESFVRWVLPESLEERALGGAVRWTPERLAIATAFSDQEGEISRFDQIVTQPIDQSVIPLFRPRTTLDTSAEVAIRPFRALTAEVVAVSGRDLLPAEDVVADSSVQALLQAERAHALGVDLGWETRRTLRTRLAFQPRVGDWLRTDLIATSRYGTDRDPSYVDVLALPGDTLIALQRNATGGRELSSTFTLIPSAVGDRLFNDSTQSGGVRFLRSMNPVRVAWRRGTRSLFNRDVIDPGLDFQLGLTNVNGFRFVDGVLAAVLSDRETWTAGTGFRLPGSAALTVNYQQGSADVLDTRSERRSTDRTWPNARISFDDVPVPGFIRPLVSRLGFSAGYTKSRRTIGFGGASAQSRETNDRRLPLDASVSWGGVVNMSYRASFTDGVGTDPTGDTERDLDTHAVSIQSAFVPPFGLDDFFVQPIQVSLQYQYGHQEDCRATAEAADCVAFIDQLNRSFNVTLNSTVRNLRVGLQTGFVDRQSFVGLRNGTRQLQMILFGQFDLAARLFAGGAGLR